MKRQYSYLKLLAAVCLLQLFALPLNAQYYIDAYNKGGLKYSYISSNLDSLVFGGSDQESYMIVYPKLYFETKYLISELDSVGLSAVPISNSPEYIDLGLSVNWATYNVGAYRPEDYGNYYAWGEISIKKDYGLNNYKFGRYGVTGITKYCLNSSAGRNGFVDNKTTLDLEDDVAHVEWGDNWRIPTYEEVQELIDNCNWVWTIRNGVKGYEIRSKREGYENHYIFLPVAGYRSDRSLQGAGFSTTYTINTLQSTRDCWRLCFNANRIYLQEDNRIYGMPVRPVWTKQTLIEVNELKFALDEAEIMLGHKKKLEALAISGDSVVEVELQWSSNDETIATVDSTGLVTANKIGECVITAAYRNLAANCSIKVVDPYVEAGLSVQLDKDTLTLVVGDQTTLTATVKDSVGNTISYDIPWHSSNPEIATIDKNGVVTAISVGATTIYIPCKDSIVSCGIRVNGKIEGVNLGLSVEWATFNIGANKPEDYGDYFAWGETAPKNKYRADSYTNPSLYWNEYNNMALEPQCDAAHVLWGGDWRMPTVADFTELIENCIWYWTSVNDVSGFMVTSKVKGFTDKSVFFPASGYCNDSIVDKVNKRAYYWTSEKISTYPSAIDMSSSFGYNISGILGYIGSIIRPVRPSKNGTVIASVKLDKNFANIELNKSLELNATIKSTLGTIDTTAVWSSSDGSIATVDSKGKVTAVSKGQCIIYAECGNEIDMCSIIVVDYKEPEYIDLGLSVLWATSNIGAEDPKDYGYYYAWGETDTKYDYTSYKWSSGNYNASNYKLNKYNTDSYYSYSGNPDNIIQLETEDDVAYVKLGEQWRIPTKGQFEELLENCTIQTVISSNGQNGCLFTSTVPGFTDKSIFLPFAGWRYDNTSINEGSSCFYWTSSLVEALPISAWSLYISPDNKLVKEEARYDGCVIRPVRLKE